jgi:hypothetical protein
MSANLVSLASKYLTPELLGKFASVLGEGQNAVAAASTAAVPALLNALAGVASTKDGIGRLQQAMSQQDADSLGALGESVGGTGWQNTIATGTRTLVSMFGRGDLTKMASAVARFAGLNSSSSGSSILSMLGPLVLGVLSKEAHEQDLDMAGVAKLLRSQRDSFRAAMPSEFQNLLQSSGYAPPPPVAEPREADPAWTSQVAAKGNSTSRNADWVLWLLPVLALGAFAWWFFSMDPQDPVGGQETARVQQPADPAPSVNTTAAIPDNNVTVAGVDVTSKITSALDGMRSALQDITDEASARSALPRLQEASSEFETIADLLGRLPEEAKSKITALIAAARPTLETSIDRVLAIPGASSVAKPAIESLRGKLSTLSTA